MKTQHVFETEADNWYGVEDPKERKKIQDRLAQRARRRRIAQANRELLPSPAIAAVHRGRRKGDQDDDAAKNDNDQTMTREQSIAMMAAEIQKARRFFKSLDFIDAQSLDPSSFASLPSPSDSNRRSNQMSASGRPSGRRRGRPPLAGDPGIDSRYLSLVEGPITVYAALWHNGTLLGIKCSSEDTRHVSDARQRSAAVPDSLHPTDTQLQVAHRTWIDRFPFHHFRDNMIACRDVIDTDRFLEDLFTLKSFTLLPGARAWDPLAWRMGKDFGARWGFLFISEVDSQVS